LLRDAVSQVVQPAPELENLLLVVDSLQSGGGDRSIQSAGTV
jgi:hypothetical protein